MTRRLQAVAGLQTPCHGSPPYKALNSSRKCHNNPEKKEREGGKEMGVRGRGGRRYEALPVFHLVGGNMLILTLLIYLRM
jgi:hypothetical protein